MLTGGFFGTYVIAVPFVAWILTQVVKIVLYGRFKQFRSWRDLFKSGGMPSAHTSFMGALTVAILIKEGIQSTSFAIALAISAIVVYDAIHVRMESGKHGAIFNEIFQSGQVTSVRLEEDYPLETSVGHTIPEVFGGGIFGVILGILLMYL